jgi:hypothetical protein
MGLAGRSARIGGFEAAQRERRPRAHRSARSLAPQSLQGQRALNTRSRLAAAHTHTHKHTSVVEVLELKKACVDRKKKTNDRKDALFEW